MSRQHRKKLTDRDRAEAEAVGRKLTQTWARIFPRSADRLWMWRQTANKTQAQMAEECGLSASAIGNVERGYNLPKGTTLIAIAEGCGLNPNYLLNLSKKTDIT